MKLGLYTHIAWLQCYEIKKKRNQLYITYICSATGIFVIHKIKSHYNNPYIKYIGEV